MPEPIHINRIREILNAFLVDAANAREANQGIYVSALTELSGALPEPSGAYNNDEVRRLIRDATEALSRAGAPLSEDAIAQRLFAEVEFRGGRVVRDNRGNPVVNYDPVTGLGAGVEGGLTATQTLVLSEFTRELDERNPLYMTSGRKIVHLASQMQQNGLISAPLYNMMVSHDFSPQNIAALQATYPDVDLRDAYQLVSQFEQQLAGSVNGLQSATPGRSWDQIVTTSVRSDRGALEEGGAPDPSVLALPVFGYTPQQLAERRLDYEYSATLGGAGTQAQQKASIQTLLGNWFPGRLEHSGELRSAHGAVGREIEVKALAAGETFSNLYFTQTRERATPDQVARAIFDELVAQAPQYDTLVNQRIQVIRQESEDSDVRAQNAKLIMNHSAAETLVRNTAETGYAEDGSPVGINLSEEQVSAFARGLQRYVTEGGENVDYRDWLRANITDRGSEINEFSRTLSFADISDNINYIKEFAADVGLDLSGISDADLFDAARWLQSNGAQLSPAQLPERLLRTVAAVVRDARQEQAGGQAISQYANNPNAALSTVRTEAFARGLDLGPEAEQSLSRSLLNAARAAQESGSTSFDPIGFVRGQLDVSGQQQAQSFAEQTFGERLDSPGGRADVARDLYVELGHLGSDTDPRTRNYIEDVLIPREAQRLEFLDTSGIAGIGDLIGQSATDPRSTLSLPDPQQSSRSQQIIDQEFTRLYNAARTGQQLSAVEIDRLEEISPSRRIGAQAQQQVTELVSRQRAPIGDASGLFADTARGYGDNAGRQRSFLSYLLSQQEGLRSSYASIPASTTTFDREGFRSLIERTEEQALSQPVPSLEVEGLPSLPSVGNAVTGTSTDEGVAPLNSTQLAILDPAQRGSLSRAFTSTTHRPSFESFFQGRLPSLIEAFEQTPQGLPSIEIEQQAPTRRSSPTIYDFSRRR